MNETTQAVRDVLTPLQVTKIEQFCNDKDMYEAVRKVLLSGIYTHGVVQKGVKHNPLVNGAFSLVALAGTNPIPDAELGAHLRGQWFGVNALEMAFSTIDKIKSKKAEAKESPYNEAI
jgi:hypothetical protein